MKRVLHILNSLLPSGAETMLKVSAGYWDKELEKHILATKEEVGQYACQLERADYIVHHIYKKNYFAQHMAVIKLIRKYRFDIVHVHRQGQALSYEVDGFLGGARRVIRTVHNVFQFKGIVRLRETFTRRIACLIGVTHIAIGISVKENEEKRFGIQCDLINNWYDDNKFTFINLKEKKDAREKLHISEDCYCIVSIGNCSSIKNHMSILRALVIIREECANKKILYIHVGKGVDEEEEIRFINNNNLNDCVQYVGFQDPYLYLKGADLYIMPSCYEGVSIAALEAMSTGIPCLFTDVPGLKDFKKYQFDNVCFCKLNDDDINKKLLQFVRKGQSEKVKNIYGIKQGVEAYQRVYFR